MSSLDTCVFYGILDTRYVSKDSWVEKYTALVAGGAGLVQIRAKNASPSEYSDLVELILNYRSSRNQPETEQPDLIINDDIELCLRFPHLGLHIEHSNLPPEEIRKILGPDRILGVAATSQDEVDSVNMLGPKVVSYFSVGSVFDSQTKPEAPQAGLDLVRYTASKMPELPFFCIGGINRNNIHEVRDAGARRIVTVADVLCDADTSAAVRHSIELIRS